MNIHRQFSLPVNRCHQLRSRTAAADTFTRSWIELPRIIRRAKDQTNVRKRRKGFFTGVPCSLRSRQAETGEDPWNERRAPVVTPTSANRICAAPAEHPCSGSGGPPADFSWISARKARTSVRSLRNATRKTRSGRRCLSRPACASGSSNARLSCPSSNQPARARRSRSLLLYLGCAILLPSPTFARVGCKRGRSRFTS